jgi:hypothetical protein
MIDASQRMITINNQGEEIEGMSPPQKRYLALQIKTLEKAPAAGTDHNNQTSRETF